MTYEQAIQEWKDTGETASCLKLIKDSVTDDTILDVLEYTARSFFYQGFTAGVDQLAKNLQD